MLQITTPDLQKRVGCVAKQWKGCCAETLTDADTFSVTCKSLCTLSLSLSPFLSPHTSTIVLTLNGHLVAMGHQITQVITVNFLARAWPLPRVGVKASSYCRVVLMINIFLLITFSANYIRYRYWAYRYKRCVHLQHTDHRTDWAIMCNTFWKTIILFCPL